MFYFGLIVTVLGLAGVDQLIKYLVVANIPLFGEVKLIPGFVRLTYVRNTGAAFSMLEGQQWFFYILTAAFLALMVVCVVKKWFTRPYLWMLAVITGGAVGNLIDRVLYGSVVDMFDFQFMSFAVFNFADICITCGAVALAVYVLFIDKDGLKDKKPEAPSAEEEKSE